MSSLLDELIQITDYSHPEVLWRPGSPVRLPSDLRQRLDRFSPQLAAIYLHENRPAVYFALDPGENGLFHLHQQLWNYNQGALLVGVSDNTAHFFDCFRPPDPDSNAVELLRLDNPLAPRHRERILPFHRSAFLSGQTTVEKNWFLPDTRVDQALLKNLMVLRDALQDQNLPRSVANRLVLRSLLIRYLEDRLVLPQGEYLKVLGQGPEAVWTYYRRLANLFNGDILYIEDHESAVVKPPYLQLLRRWLEGEDLASGQLSFWPYDFACIPPELLSSVYEVLVGRDPQHAAKTSAYYTPRAVVDAVLDAAWKALPDPHKEGFPSVLDGACGSGAFLASAFRRIVDVWLDRHPEEPLSPAILHSLVRSHIYGIDIDPDAIQLAILSCCLVMLDFLESTVITQDFRFPKLLNQNFWAGNFLGPATGWSRASFQLIVGNPPWNNPPEWPNDSWSVALQFTKRAAHLLDAKGVLALVLPAGWLYNQRKGYREFQDWLPRSLCPRTIIDLTALRQGLFSRAKAPGVVLVASTKQRSLPPVTTFLVSEVAPNINPSISLKFFAKQRYVIPIDTEWREPPFWKGLRQGSLRPYHVLLSCRHRFPKLKDQVSERQWAAGEGIHTQSPGAPGRTPELANRPAHGYLYASALSALHIDSSQVREIPGEATRWRRDIRQFQGPMVLVGGGKTAEGRVPAAYTAESYYYGHSLFGITGPNDDEDFLRGLAVLLNSSVVGYLLYLLSANWGVERGKVNLGEILSLPCPPTRLSVHKYTEFKQAIKESKHDQWDMVDLWAMEQYGLTDDEILLIKDFTHFRRYQHDKSLVRGDARISAPKTSDLQTYLQTLQNTLSEALSVDSVATTVRGMFPKQFGPIQSVALVLNPSAKTSLPSSANATAMLTDTELVNEVLSEGQALRFAFGAVWLLKLARAGWWTPAMALYDADWLLSELLDD